MISITIIIICGFLSAVQDTLASHWSTSIFKKLANGYPRHFFGTYREVWKRKYIRNDPNAGLKPFMGTPVIGWFLHIFLDAWHVAKAVKVALICILPLTSPIVFDNLLLTALIHFGLFSLTFNIFYHYILYRENE